MREINIQELLIHTQQLVGKKVEVGLHNPFSTNTYSQFAICEDGNELVLYDKNQETPHQLRIDNESVSKIIYSNGNNFFEMCFNIFLNNDTSIDFCVSEKEIICCKCGEVINIDQFATIWTISGTGSYGSKFDNEKLSLHLCDHCLYYDILGYKDGE